jgi:hypothetical protein
MGTKFVGCQYPAVVSGRKDQFGGSRNNRLFITATTNVFAVFLNVRGLNYPFKGRTALL